MEESGITRRAAHGQSPRRSRRDALWTVVLAAGFLMGAVWLAFSPAADRPEGSRSAAVAGEATTARSAPAPPAEATRAETPPTETSRAETPWIETSAAPPPAGASSSVPAAPAASAGAQETPGSEGRPSRRPGHGPGIPSLRWVVPPPPRPPTLSFTSAATPGPPGAGEGAGRAAVQDTP